MPQNMLGVTLHEAHGPLNDLNTKLAGEEGQKWFKALKLFLRKENPWDIRKRDVWKTIRIGTKGLKTADEFRKALGRGKHEIIGDTYDMIGKPAFKVSETEMEVDLINVSVGELGLENHATNAQIFKRAKELGLELCPNEVGPQLRLQYADQPNGECILIAMEPIAVSVSDLKLFRVERYSGGSSVLDSSRGRPNDCWHAAARFVFVRPRK